MMTMCGNSSSSQVSRRGREENRRTVGLGWGAQKGEQLMDFKWPRLPSRVESSREAAEGGGPRRCVTCKTTAAAVARDPAVKLEIITTRARARGSEKHTHTPNRLTLMTTAAAAAVRRERKEEVSEHMCLFRSSYSQLGQQSETGRWVHVLASDACPRLLLPPFSCKVKHLPVTSFWTPPVGDHLRAVSCRAVPPMRTCGSELKRKALR